MIEVKTPRDIMAYETKVFGPLTLKQLICIIIAIVLDIFLYSMIIKPYQLPEKLAFYVIAITDIPILAFGYCKPKGISLDKYIKMIYQTAFLAPTLRKNKVAFIKKDEAAKKKIKKSKKYKAYK